MNDPRPAEELGYRAALLTSYARIHATRVLFRISNIENIDALVGRFIPLLFTDFDELKDQLPFLVASLGTSSLVPLQALAEDCNQGSEVRQRAAICMDKVALAHQEIRDGVVEFRTRTLEMSGDDDELAGSLVAGLTELRALDKLPIIEQAYRDGRVDPGYIRLRDVYAAFGIKAKKPTR